jgi:hypothetical protein
LLYHLILLVNTTTKHIPRIMEMSTEPIKNV